MLFRSPIVEAKQENTVEALKNDLKQAIKEQRFEDAAVLRDRIKDLTQEA